MFKNEADIIESFIRYHSYIFDGIVLLDNGSTDNSVKIISSLQNEGLPVYLEIDSTIEFTQGEKTTELLSNTFKKFKPDMVFLLDLDEFVIAPNYPSNPREIINKLNTDEILYYIQRQHYHPLSSDNYEELFIPKRIRHVQILEDESPKVIITRGIKERYSPKIYMGNHDVAIDKTNVSIEVLSQLKLAHFQYRSLEHVKSKFMVGWLNNLTRPNYINGQSRHWKWFYNLIKENAQISLEEIIGKPPCIEAPINLSFCDTIDIKYTSKDEIDYFKNLLNFCENLAKEYAKLRKELSR